MALDSPLGGLAGTSPVSGPGHHDRCLRVSVAEAVPVGAMRPPGRLVLDTTVDGRRLHWATSVPGGHLLRVPEVADFVLCDDATRVVVRPAPGVDPAALVLLVRGLVLAFALAVTGECVLHASAVTADDTGGAVAFAGPSGTGKSTLAAACCAEGARFVTDDLLRVGLDRTPRWVGRAAELRLRPGAPGVPPGWVHRTTPDGRLGALPPPALAPCGPLRALVLPVPVAAGPVRVRRLAAAVATTRLVGAHRIVHWVEPALLRQQLAQSAALARAVPVLEAEVPWPGPVRAGVGASLLRQVLDVAGSD